MIKKNRNYIFLKGNKIFYIKNCKKNNIDMSKNNIFFIWRFLKKGFLIF